MVSAEALEMSNAIRSRATERQRIGVTELARGTAWREKLVGCKILEVVDRGSTAGWLLSQEGMSSLLDTISYFEEEAERAQVAYIVEARSARDDWNAGEDLRQAVEAEAENTLGKLKAALDGD